MEKLDLLGGNLSFYTYNNETIKSKFGGCISLLTIIILGLLIGAFGQDFFKRTNPILVQSTLSPLDYPNHIINNKNFSFAFRLEDDNGLVVDSPEYFYIKVTYSNSEKDEKGSWVTKDRYLLDTPKCTKDMFFDGAEFVEQTDIGTNTIFCPQFKNISLGGYWDASFVRRFQIEVFQCIEGQFTPDKKPCGSNKDREKLLANKLYLSLFYQVVVVTPNNYNSGLQRYIKNNYYSLDTRIQKNPYYFFEETIMYTDFGWLLKENKNINLLGFKNNYMDIISLDALESGLFAGSLTRALFYFEKDTKEFYREYQKAQNLAAQVGGILKLFITIGSFIVHRYNLMSLKLNVRNLTTFTNNKKNSKNNEEFLSQNSQNKIISPFKANFSISKKEENKFNSSNKINTNLKDLTANRLINIKDENNVNNIQSTNQEKLFFKRFDEKLNQVKLNFNNNKINNEINLQPVQNSSHKICFFWYDILKGLMCNCFIKDKTRNYYNSIESEFSKKIDVVNFLRQQCINTEINTILFSEEQIELIESQIDNQIFNNVYDESKL
jgi:hypothetical protein